MDQSVAFVLPVLERGKPSAAAATTPGIHMHITNAGRHSSTNRMLRRVSADRKNEQNRIGNNAGCETRPRISNEREWHPPTDNIQPAGVERNSENASSATFFLNYLLFSEGGDGLYLRRGGWWWRVGGGLLVDSWFSWRTHGPESH